MSPRRSLVHSEDEIPQHFASEDEEREWWATHDLSARMLRESKPSYSDLGLLLPLNLRAREAPNVATLLAVAAKSTSLAERKPDREVGRSDVRLEHALISIIFSAAAVEGALRLHLLAKTGALHTDSDLDVSVGNTNAAEWNSSMRTQLRAVAHSVDELAASKDVLREIEELFARRDFLVHGVAASPDAPEAADPSRDDIAFARRSYDAAVSFLDVLALSPRNS